MHSSFLQRIKLNFMTLWFSLRFTEETLSVEIPILVHQNWYRITFTHNLLSYTDFDSGYLRIHDVETGLMVGMTGQKGMLTPPRHLVPSPVYLGNSPIFFSLTCNSYMCFQTYHSLVHVYLSHFTNYKGY
jgi:hypothetical protein